MAATLGVDTIQHTNGTTAVTVGTNGSVTAAGTLGVTGLTSLTTMNTTGNVGIGTSSPQSELHLSTASSPEIRLTDTTNSVEANFYTNDTLGSVGSKSNHPFAISTNNTERMRIDSSGNTMVGRSSAQARFSIGGASATAASSTICRIGDADYASAVVLSVAPGIVQFDAAGVAGGRMKIDANGNFAIPASYSHTTASAANTFFRSDGYLQRSTSSLRYKNTVEDATHGLTELLTLRPVTYKGNDDGNTVFGGLIAEEVHDSGLTEFVQYNDDNEPEALAYGNMVSLCIKAIQELSAKNDTLEARLAASEA